MAELSPKKPIRRAPVRKAANSPAPAMGSGMGASSGPTCGHDGCGTACNVRYVGPTSHMRDHHIVHTARGISHVWTAAIVAGLAVVLTGAVAWTAVDAQQKTTMDPNVAAVREGVDKLGKRMDRMEDLLKQLMSQCKASAATCSPTDGGSAPKPGSSTDPEACYEGCVSGGVKTKAECRKACGVPEPTNTNTASAQCLQACTDQAAACKKASLTGATTAEKCGDLYTQCASKCK